MTYESGLAYDPVEVRREWNEVRWPEGIDVESESAATIIPRCRHCGIAVASMNELDDDGYCAACHQALHPDGHKEDADAEV